MAKKTLEPVSAQPTPEVQQQLRQFYAQAQQATQIFQVYAQGVKDALGLKGAYTLNVSTMTFERDEPKKEEQKI